MKNETYRLHDKILVRLPPAPPRFSATDDTGTRRATREGEGKVVVHILEIRTPSRANAGADEVYVRGYVLPPDMGRVHCGGSGGDGSNADMVDTGQMVIFRAGDVVGMAPRDGKGEGGPGAIKGLKGEVG